MSQRDPSVGEGGDFTYEKDGDACRLAKCGIFQILVSLRVFWRELHYMWPCVAVRSCLGFHTKKYFTIRPV